ncbi:Serine/threonine-protein kinase SULU [Trichinella britovi]|uniref:Probable tRNA(His) guanylyltransferase n=1 Tax=Trichinella britovi TaxID=45882 RepID=A0A0V1CA12_TRIBR|nr:Serine/threonine-protein kinase SULU [Trichinella britovi]
MPIALKPGSLKDPEIAALFRTEDPESYFADLREIGHGSFGAKWNDIVKEVKFLKNLRHENIVEFKACFLKDHTCWLVMEYCVGSASDILEVHKKPLREQEISAICQQVLHGLRYLHSLGRIHRDVKAGNILLTDSGVVKLADFGSASLVCPAQSFVGTPYWMAPEVILAMDEGRYNDRADVWSLGITCIELGTEKKPPFFNMNAMSALYHIAQNDSPSLPVGSWSSDFHDFVDQCLIKDPALRFSTETCLLHPFISSARPASILFDLIQRTKLLVRDLDHFQYRKLRKLMYLDEQQSGSSAEVSSLDSEDIDSVDDDLCAESASSRSDSYTSTQSLCGAMRSSITSVSSLKKAQRSLVPIVPLADDSTTSPLSRTPPPSGSVDTDTDTDVTPPRPSLTPTAKTASMEMNHEQQQQQQHQHQQQEQQQQLSIVGPRRRKEEILAWRRSRFATIRPTVTIAREQTEYAAENNMHEQMSGYKRMRREHQKELKQLEEKFNSEMDNLKMKLDREYENLLLQFHKEMDKLHVTHRQELDKRLKTNEELERKLRKAIVQQQEVEMKALQMQLKKEYKVNKERLKQELKMENSSKSFVEGNLKTSKQNHLHVQAEAENRLIADHKFYLDFEIRKLKRRRLLHYHQLEQDLIREELGVRGRQLQSAHTLLRRHHELTRDLEMRQLNSLQNLRCQHLQKQHASELQNQQAYMKRVQDELRKKHAMQVKQQPKELKQKELQIRRQFRQAVKTQTRQYKLLQLQLTQDLPKDEQREVVARLKDEQKRKLALLAEQYEGSIGEMMEKQTVQLETWQEEEARQTKDKLNEELELLMAFQSKQRMQMDQHHEREKGRLNEKVSLRLAVLENKMDDEVTQFERERQDRLNQLQTRQNQELDVFDQASIHLGFSLIALSASSSSTSTASGSSSSATAVANKPGVINSASIQDAIHQQPTTDNSFQAVTAHHHHQHLSSSSSSSKQRYELLEEDYRKNGRIEGMPILKKEEVCVAFSVDYNKICDSFERLEKRSSIVFSLLQAYGLLDQVRLFKPLIADESTVGVFHSDDYISFVKNASAGLIAEVEDVESEPMRDYGLGYDCPIFPALYEYGRATVGATVHCAQLLVDGKAKLAVNVNGGWHHARRSAAAGFCYFNDCVVGILKLRERFKRVLYIDLDAHHGDAVEDAFCSTRSVLTVSLHCYEAGFYPCSGSMDDVGVGSGKYYAVNVPFRQGLVDEQLLSTFDALVPKIVHLYRPEVVFLQLGTDGLAGDPVAAFNLTPSAYAGVVCRVLGFGKPCLLVGGGGYKPTNVSRCWALVLGALLGQNLDDDIPEHAFFSAYGPDFVLCNRHSTGTIPNLNTDHQLNELYILERNKKNKNGTRRKNCPKLWLVMEPDDDLIAWVDPDLLAREKKITAIKKMLYASSGISNGLPSSTSSTRTTINDGRLSLSSLADSVAQLRFANSGDSGNSNENASSTAVERSRSLDSCLFVEFDPLNDEHYSSTSANPAEVESGPDLVVEESKKPTEGDNHAACGQQFFHLVDYCSNASLQTRRLVDYSKSVIADLVDQSDIYRKLVVSRRRFDLVSPDTSLKVTVHTPFDQTAPVLLFACHIRSSIGQIIGCVLCSFNSTRLLPIEQYAIKRFGVDEYLLPDSSLADYVFIHDCLKLGHDPELELVDLAKIIQTAKIDESSLLPTLINNNNNVNSTTGIGLLKRDDLQVVLNTIRQECEKLIDESAAVDAVHRKVNSKFVVQSVKALCSLFHRVENLSLIKAVKKFITACNMEIVVNGEMQSEIAIRKKYKNVKNAISYLVDAIEKFCINFCQSFEVDFSVELSANFRTDPSTSCPFRPLDITDSEVNFHFMIETVHSLPQNWTTKYSQFYLACHLIHGDRELCSAFKTNCGRSDRHFYEYLLFDAWITLPIPLCALPRETKLCLALYGQRIDSNPSSCDQNSSTTAGIVACLIDEQLCFSVTPLFDIDNILLNGTKFVTFYPGSELKSWLPQLSCQWSESPICVVSFPYNEPKMRFPHILPNATLNIGKFDQLDCNVKLLLEDMIENRALKELDRDEKDFIWEKRIYLTNFDEALPLVLSSAISWDWACLSNIYALVQLWRPVPTGIAMELLLPNCPDEFVRKYAVSCLECNPVDSLMDILPQLVEVLRFERFECSSLAECLLKFAVESRAFAELESHKTHPGLGLRCRLLQNVLVTVVGPGMPTEVRLQVELLSRLDSISEMVKRESRDDKKSKALLVQLHLLDSWLLQTHVRVPLNPSVLAVGVFTENSKIYRSLTCPVKVSFRTVSSNFDVMYKSGDDLRQDSLVLQMIRLMDHLWLKENLDLRMVVFRILPLQDKKGVIELVKNSKTLREIQVEEGGMTGVLRDDLIQKWLQKQNPSELEYQIALKNFRLSCAGWSVGTYVLGIGDRHNDNVMITSKGHLFHIDFGKYLGDAQMFGSFRRDRVPFLLTNDMLYAINAGESTKSAFFQQFVDCCCNAFNIIRKHSTLFVNLMQLVMLYSSIPGLTRDSIAYMYQNFWLECTDSEASMRFTRLIEETLRSKFPKLNFLVHTVVQGQRKTGHLSTGQILSFVPQTYTAQTDGTIQSVQVIDCEKWHVPAKVYMYKMKVERENVKVPSFVYRSYDEFCEFAESIYFRFPLIKMHSLPRGVTLRSNVRGVAVRRQSEIAQFIRSLFHYAEEISHSDLVYTFFHPIFRDEQADIKSKTQNLHHPENVSGEVKVQVEFRQGLLEIFINHARNLSLINGINLPDSYVKCYILPDKRGWSKKKTRVVRGTRDPTYNEMFVYRVPASQLKCKVLEISVWHYDLLKGNNFLGSIAIPMADICDIPVQMANTKWAYVRKFEQAEMCLMNTWIVVRLDGCSFRRFTEEHRFEKPNDLAGLKLMYSAAKSVMNNYKDIRIAYGHSDEFSFVFWKRTNLWNRRLQKFVSTITSLFTSNYIFQWNFHFNDNRPLIWAPCFDGRVILYPTDENLTDYLKWRQADCHINNLYNTVFWKLVNEGQLKPAEAEKRLCGSTAADKNEILFSQFNTNYNNEPDIFRKGTVLYRNVDGETVNTFHGSIIDDQFWQSNAHLLN